MLGKLFKESEEFGLQINVSKTKIMPIGISAKQCQDSCMYVNGKKIEVVDHFEYLGRVLNNQADDTAAVLHRISKG